MKNPYEIPVRIEPNVRNTLEMVAALRHFADTLETYGPACVSPGCGLGRTEKDLWGSLSIVPNLSAIEHPPFGISVVCYVGVFYQWDGLPRRDIKRGEFYLSEATPPTLGTVIINRANRTTRSAFFHFNRLD